MKTQVLKAIDTKLSNFHKGLESVVKEYLEFQNEMYYGKYSYQGDKSFAEFEDYICDSFYSNNNKNIWLGKVRRVAKECGLKVAGFGRTRIALETTYRGNPIIIKVAMAKKENVKEYKSLSNVKKSNFKNIMDLVLMPTHEWDNKQWGKILAYPKAPVVAKGDWDVDSAAEGDWRFCGLPKRFQTKKIALRLSGISRLTADTHGFNIGFVNSKPYLIDCNFFSSASELKWVEYKLSKV